MGWIILGLILIRLDPLNIGNKGSKGHGKRPVKVVKTTHGRSTRGRKLTQEQHEERKTSGQFLGLVLVIGIAVMLFATHGDLSALTNALPH